MFSSCEKLFSETQQNIVEALSALDIKDFISDKWQRPDISGGHGGGGLSRILKNGNIFEQAGVNFSSVEGNLPLEMSQKLVGSDNIERFRATGVSLVIHPYSPMVPTVHANFRFLEVGNKSWFGGGLDLTPYYLFEEDAIHFHRTIKSVCDRHDSSYYPDFKTQCDNYFYLPHRKETRGIGGIFFDYLGRDSNTDLNTYSQLVEELCSCFIPAYLPIVKKRKEEVWGESEKSFQLIRRGRYVEFNLLYDRGTLFGLKTGGRVESILMSLPPQVRWEYDYKPSQDSREADLIELLKNPKDWA
jgi:coproporphyrinogen III oxidase